MWNLSNAFTSAFKELEPIPQYKATASWRGFLHAVRLGERYHLAKNDDMRAGGIFMSGKTWADGKTFVRNKKPTRVRKNCWWGIYPITEPDRKLFGGHPRRPSRGRVQLRTSPVQAVHIVQLSGSTSG